MFLSTLWVKLLQKLSYSFLMITLSCKDFLYNFSKDLIVSWSRSYCFLYFLYLFMFIFCNTLLPNDRLQAIATDIGKTIKPIPVIDRVIEVDAATMITSTAYCLLILILCLELYNFYISFLICYFCF